MCLIIVIVITMMGHFHVVFHTGTAICTRHENQAHDYSNQYESNVFHYTNLEVIIKKLFVITSSLPLLH